MRTSSDSARLSQEPCFDDRIVEGYIYKTLEQAFSAKGDKPQADRYLAKALAVFQALAHETIPEEKTVTQFAGVMNGMGNLRAARGQHREAIGDYRVATLLVPTYAYAWHDMFLSYHALAAQGDVDLAAMREALAKTKVTGWVYALKGWPPFGPAYFARLDTMMARIEKANSRRRPRKKR